MLVIEPRFPAHGSCTTSDVLDRNGGRISGYAPDSWTYVPVMRCWQACAVHDVECIRWKWGWICRWAFGSYTVRSGRDQKISEQAYSPCGVQVGMSSAAEKSQIWHPSKRGQKIVLAGVHRAARRRRYPVGIDCGYVDERSAHLNIGRAGLLSVWTPIMESKSGFRGQGSGKTNLIYCVLRKKLGGSEPRFTADFLWIFELLAGVRRARSRRSSALQDLEETEQPYSPCRFQVGASSAAEQKNQIRASFDAATKGLARHQK
ncbi:hypothetical protein B0H11DRAFT_1930839 [Mycena galericulata]|nr:hypothetical protein B0H11DRAFT_1930839 [Mycena galericulata]